VRGKYGVAMSVAGAPNIALIRTKVHRPIARALVPRPALIERLVHGPARRLTLVRGQAGWGKSSVLAAWSAADPRTFAWLALDRGDNDPVRFFMYVIEALHTMADSVGERSASILHTPGVDIVDQVLPILINELDALADPTVFVLDDYHAINQADIHQAVAYFLEHAPQSLELVISTRVEPPLPVSRLRGRGELLEIASADLRFSVDDAYAMLVSHQGLALGLSDVRRLVERTEGWPAGLYMAALSLAGQAAPHEFIDAFAGDDRNVMDYLTTEVLAGQAVETRAFMLATSVLDRLCAPLCDEILDSTASAAMLRSIEGSNSFLIALDHRREWYRYHHLFRELLRNELLSSDPTAAATINRRAAIWLGDRGFVSEAISHLVAAGEVEEAGELIASSWLRLASSGEHETVRVWLELLPFALREGDSRLCVASALVAIATGRLDEVGRWIDQAARAPAGGPFHDGFSSGAAAADCLRTIHNWLLGDLGASRAAGEAAILGADERSRWDAVTYTWLGASQFWLGHPEEGLAALREALARCRAASFNPPWIACLSMLGLIHHLQGDRDAARACSEEALAMSARLGLNEYNRLTAAAHVTRAGLLTGAGRAEEARDELQRVVEFAHRGSGPVEIAHAQVALSMAAQAVGDAADARTFLGQARAVITACPDPGPVVTALLHRAESRLGGPRRVTQPLAPVIADFSEREMAVMHLLASSLSQREIGSMLFISVNTVKTHSKSIFRKLGAATRAEAVARARELDLIH
jgi:LuxR family transcriptional regulator, maltose regulon positive regulatory protein